MNFHLAAALVFFGPSLVQAQKCPSEFPKKIQGKCFNFPMKKASFHEASEFCMSSGGRLFEPQNNAASQKVSKMALNKFTNYWIGINDINTEGAFVFDSSGSEIKESSWANNQPDNYDGMEHCTTVSTDGFWYDDLCSLEKNFVCEEKATNQAFWLACPVGWDLINKKCYHKGDDLANFDDAVSYCESVSGSVFEPTYGKQEMMVLDTYGLNNSWLGITDKQNEGKFKYYSNSEVVGYTNWPDEEPNSNGDCVVSMNGAWSDQSCRKQSFPVICQDKPETVSCPNDKWVMIENRCFFISQKKNKLSYSKAKSKCAKWGARLFEPRNLHSHTKISNFYGKKDIYWLGIIDKTGEYDFVYQSDKNTEISFSKWKQGEPKKKSSKSKDDCVQVKRGEWSDSPCKPKRLYVCEIPSEDYQEFWDSPALNPTIETESLKSYIFQKFMTYAPPKESSDPTMQTESSKSYLSFGGCSQCFNDTNGLEGTDMNANEVYLIDLGACESCGKWMLSGTTLTNMAGVTLSGSWVIPDTGNTGTIENTDTTSYLGVQSIGGFMGAGSPVVEEDLDADDLGQQWERSDDDDSGYFTLKNPNSGKFLTAVTENQVTIEGHSCLQSELPIPMFHANIQIFRNRLIVCSSYPGVMNDTLEMASQKCYIWAANNQWEGFTPPSGSFLHSVRLPGMGIWYLGQDLSSSVLLNETTGKWDSSFTNPWSNKRNISSSCVIQISDTKTATIGDNTVDIYDWATDTEHVSNVTLINTRTTLASCVLIPKGIDGNPTVAIVGQELTNGSLSMELWDTVNGTVSLIPYPSGYGDFIYPETLAIDDETFIISNAWNNVLNSGLNSTLIYNVNAGWTILDERFLGALTYPKYTLNGLYQLNDPSIEGFAGLNNCQT